MLGVGVEWKPNRFGAGFPPSCGIIGKGRVAVAAPQRRGVDGGFGSAAEMAGFTDRKQCVEVTRQAIVQADENLRIARDRYQQQVGTNTEVLDAETLRVQAYTNFYNSSYESVLTELRLRRAVGNL